MLAAISFQPRTVSGQDDIATTINKRINAIESSKIPKAELHIRSSATGKITMDARIDNDYLNKLGGDSLYAVRIYSLKHDYTKYIFEFNTNSVKRMVSYYFDNQKIPSEQIIAINEEITPLIGDRKQLTYYFTAGQLYKIYDETGKDQTQVIDKEELYLRIRRIFDIPLK